MLAYQGQVTGLPGYLDWKFGESRVGCKQEGYYGVSKKKSERQYWGLGEPNKGKEQVVKRFNMATYDCKCWVTIAQITETRLGDT